MNHRQKLQKLGKPNSSPIKISYRADQGTRMHGAFFDHYTMRKITGHETLVSCAADTKIDTFTHFITKTTTHALGLGDAKGERIIPANAHADGDDCGLLFIPGGARNSEDEDRCKHEKALIKKARQRGQPILAICAGSWRLLEAYGGRTRATTDHLYANMPYILDGGYIGNNVQIHRIKITPFTLLSGAMSVREIESDDDEEDLLPPTPVVQYPTVNSVHWLVADEKALPAELLVGAVAKADDKIAPKSRQGKQLAPEEKTIEEFEAKHGAPVMAIQWHPEAYFGKRNTREDERQLNIIRYMAKAGDAYHAKRMMLKEFKQLYAPANSSGLFGLFRKEQKEADPAKVKQQPVVAQQSKRKKIGRS